MLDKLKTLLTGRSAVDAVPAAAPRTGVQVVAKGAGRGSRNAIKAGQIDRLTRSWQPFTLSSNGQIRAHLKTIRGRSREQYFNNDYAKNYYRKLKINVVGDTGFRLKSKPLDASGKVDTQAKGLIEGAFKRWGKKGVCDVTGRLSWGDCCNLFLETTARDGEVLVRRISGFDNGFGYALQFLEPDLLDVDFNQILPGGNVVRMGVEFDQWDRPVAYHLLRFDPSDVGPVVSAQTRERVPADQIKHGFLTEFIRQIRGIPWGHASMRRLRKLDEYEEAELEAARVGAAKMGFFTEDKDAEGPYEGDEETEDGELLTSAEAGTFEVLPPGVGFTPFDPQHPSGNFQPFRAGLLKAVSAGFGINHASLASDATELAFASLRHVTIEDRDFYRLLQQWMVEEFAEWVFEGFLPMAMIKKQIPLPFAKIDKFQEHEFEARSWDWVDPFKDGKAKSQELADGTTSRTAILASKGIDYEDHLRTLAREKELEAIYKVNTGAPAEAPVPPK